MSCSQVRSEFSGDRFRLLHPHPSVFCMWRFVDFPGGRSFTVYRVSFTSILVLLLIMDYIWIIGFDGAGSSNHISACLDGSQLAFIFLCLSYCLLTHSAQKWYFLRWEIDGEQKIPYRLPWILLTFSVNAIYATMIIFWVNFNGYSTLEQLLKHTVPGCLVLFDLCLSRLPFYLCHFIYVILVYFIYLSVASFGIFLDYAVGRANATLPEPANPTVWIGGHPLLPDGYSDFGDVRRILITIFGSIAMAIIIHSILVSIAIARDFLLSLCCQTSHVWTEDEPQFSSSGDLFTGRSSLSASTSNGQRNTEQVPVYADNTGYGGVADVSPCTQT
ncbi:unnamed protein product [Calicophoron daubneyi]|uniref:Uncharacterized protein n=1 Tax=Calicophoron daubneyi TaxID=300641 RepID=A0AAV2TBJ3_CALDB